MNSAPETRTAATLTPVQTRVAIALASGLSPTAASAEAKIDRSTVYDWLNNNEAFKAEYETTRQQFEDELRDQLLALRSVALKRLREVLENPDASPSVHLRAALVVLKDTLNPPAVPKVPARLAESNKIRQNPTPATADPATPRNALCPCGSGDKFKRCCGRHAPPVLSAAA